MHTYLRAIGFSNIKKGKDIEQLLKDIYENFDDSYVVSEACNQVFGEYSKSYGTDIGIKICGTEDKDGFHREYYFPYLNGSGISTEGTLALEKHHASESYAGICEDVRVGMSLVFYLQNIAAYKKQVASETVDISEAKITFSGLSVEGVILLPICKSEEQINFDKEERKNRRELIAEARNGNEEAIESLTLEDIDTYSTIVKRLQQEDVFSIVDTVFMPCGVECDQYHVMGEILEVDKTENVYTKETVYLLTISCNEITFKICMNQLDLQGEPSVGRRFKGSIWMQGAINFQED